MSTFTWIIIASAVVTYLTRVGGHLILSRFDKVHFRVEAALNAVPAAVLTTLVAPPAFDHGWKELLVLILCGALSLRLSLLPMFMIGVAVLIGLRHFI